MQPYRHILVATDFGPAAEAALDHALVIAGAFRAKVTLLHCTWLPAYYDSPYAEGLAWPTDELDARAKIALDEIARGARQSYGDVDTALVGGDPADQIRKVAKDRGADLVVLGTHGRRGLPRMLLGSVAEKVVRTCDTPVLTIRVNP